MGGCRGSEGEGQSPSAMSNADGVLVYFWLWILALLDRQKVTFKFMMIQLDATIIKARIIFVLVLLGLSGLAKCFVVYSDHHSKNFKHGHVHVAAASVYCNNYWYLPSSLPEHVQLVARSVRVGDDQPRPDDVEGGVNVHRVGVLERQLMDAILISKMTSHPLDAKLISHLHIDWTTYTVSPQATLS